MNVDDRLPMRRLGTDDYSPAPLIALVAVVAYALAIGNARAASPDQGGPTASSSSPDYVIGVEDRLEISIWKEPDLTRAVVVRPDGKISLPLVDEIVAAGRTPRELDDEITQRIGKYIVEPVVTVVVTDIESFKVFVLGEVGAQGVLTLKRRTTLLEAIAQSGGLTAFADKSNVVIVRNDEGRETRIRVDYKKILSGDRPELNLYLKPGDTIIAN